MADTSSDTGSHDEKAVTNVKIASVKTAEQINENIEEIIVKAKLAGDQEKQVTVKDAIMKYPKEILWSCVFSLGVVMAGYDAQIMTSFYALSSFQKHYGEIGSDGEYAISAAWQTALGMASPIGQILGTLACAWPLEWFGRKRTYATVNILCIALVFMQFFAPNLKVLCAGEILAGLFWGCCVLIGPTYASEISHTSIRGVLEAMNNLAFVIGQFVANGLASAMADREDRYAYKIPFAVQWIWPSIILLSIAFAPESPFWLVRQGRFEDARKSLVKVSSKSEDPQTIDNRLESIKETDALEQHLEQTTSYRDLWKGSNARRTEICSMVYSIQIFCGVPFCMNYSTFFFETAGLADSDAFNLSLGSTAIGFTFTCLSWFMLSYWGRRSLYTYGLAFITAILWVIAILDCPSAYDTNASIRWAQASLILIWSAGYQCTVGPVMFVILGEVPSTKLRGKTIAVATALQSVASLVATIIMPYILSEDEGNLRGKSGFIFGGLSLLSLAWCYFRLPETKGRTFDEIDIMFHRAVPAREFSRYDVLEEKQDIMSTADGANILSAVTSRATA